MRRLALLIFCFLLLALVSVWIPWESVAWAQGSGDTAATNPDKYKWTTDGEYGYLNPFKLLGCFLLFWLWVWTTDWVGQDCVDRKLPQASWVTPNVFIFGLTFWLLCALIPMFLGYPLAIAAWAVPLGLYVKTRNNLVHPHERVMTKDHIRYVISKWSGGKVKGEMKERWAEGPEMEIKALGGDDARNTENLYNARRLPDAYVWMKELIADMVQRRAMKVMMDYTKDTVALRYLVDGVWMAGENRDRESSDQLLMVLKTVCNLNPQERRARQAGEFFVKYEGKKITCALATQGTQTGERVLLTVPAILAKLESLADLGMGEKMLEQVKEAMRADHGLFVFTARPEGGLTTLVQAGLLTTDRFIRDFAGIEPADNREPDIMNVAFQKYTNGAGKTPEELLAAVVRNQPDALVVRQIPNQATFQLLLDQANEKRIAFTSVNVKEDAAEGVLRLLSMKIPADQYASALIGVLNTRLCRRLCPQCKEAFQPNPQLLKRLGIPQGKVEMLYKTPTPPGPDDPKKPPCDHCGGIGYYGRVGIFEFMKVNDGIRQAIVRQPKLEAIRAASKAAGNRTLQEEAIRVVATGVTSLEEVSRVLKE